MSEAFDPYFKWLGIPKADQPPHAYRLLGIELFESDADVISNAADGRMAQIKNFQTGKFGAVSQKLLNEIAAAKVCLLKPEKKAEYDQRLRAQLQKKNAASAQVQAPPIAVATAARSESDAGLAFLDFADAPARVTIRAVKREKKKSAWLIPVGIAVAVLVFAGSVVAFVFLFDGHTEKPPKGQIAAKGDGKNDAQPKPSANLAENSALHGSGDGPKTSGEPAAPRNSGLAAPTPSRPSAEGPAPKLEVKTAAELATMPADEGLGSAQEKPDDNGTAVENPPKEEPARKPPMPDQAQYQAMKSKILDIYRKEFAEAKTPDAKSALAAKLVSDGESSKGDPAERFSLWRIAAEKAVEAGDFATAIMIGDKIRADFDGDGEALKAELLANAAVHAAITPEAARSLCETAVKLAVAAVRRDEYELAARYMKLTTGSLRKVKDPQFIRDVAAVEREMERSKTRYGVVVKALETLKEDAENPQANLTVGQWYCFVKGEWDKGLPYLAKGSRDDLAAVAKQELAKPAAAQAQLAVGDSWWTVADKDRAEMAVYHSRAAYWYEQAAPGLEGLDKVRAERRSETTKQASAGTSRAASPGPRGAVQKGNVALLSNGATVSGVKNYPEYMIDPNDKRAASQGPVPCEFIITLDKVYQLQQIRFQFQPNTSNGYQILLSRDGHKYDLLESHSNELCKEWQEFRFPARPVRSIKLTSSGPDSTFCVERFEAYCFPLGSDGGSRPRSGRSSK